MLSRQPFDQGESTLTRSIGTAAAAGAPSDARESLISGQSESFDKMSISFKPEGIARVFNSDPEFQIAARFWDGTLEFGVGETLYRLSMSSGKVADIDVKGLETAPDVARGRSGHVRICAPEADWEKILMDPAPAFYLDYYSASVHHSVTLDGDPETLWAYYPAIRRTTDLFRMLVRTEREM
jgi:hypothetical protein